MNQRIIPYQDIYLEDAERLLGQLIEAEREVCDDWPQLEGIYERQMQFVLKMVAAQDGEIHLAMEDDTPVGLLTIWTETEPEGSQWPENGKEKFAFLSDIVIDKSQYGTGLADQLMEVAEDYCRRKGLSTLQLDFYRNNTRAHHFYQKQGFSDYMVVSRKTIG